MSWLWSRSGAQPSSYADLWLPIFSFSTLASPISGAVTASSQSHQLTLCARATSGGIFHSGAQLWHFWPPAAPSQIHWPTRYSMPPLEPPTWRRIQVSCIPLLIIAVLFFEHLIVGNGSHFSVTTSGNSFLPHTYFILSNTLVAPSLVKNFVSVRQFTHATFCSIEFDPFSFSVKDLWTKVEILRCNSSGDLYPFTPPGAAPSPFNSCSFSLSSRQLTVPPSLASVTWSSRRFSFICLSV